MNSVKKILNRPPEEHKDNKLSEIILGGQDGLVNVLGVILGVAAASQDSRIVIAAGLAATIAESISMGAVAFTSTIADRDYYLSELAREKREIVEVPEVEEDEIRQIYVAKGFKGELLEQIVKGIISNEQVWLSTMMSDELQLSPVEKGAPLKKALIVFLSAFIGSAVPLIPFFLLSVRNGIWVSLVISAFVLFLVGAYKAKLTIGHWAKSGVQMLVIGICSALAGYVIGLLFQAPTGM